MPPLLLLAALLTASNAFAQGPTALTVEEYVRLVLDSSPELKSAEEASKAAGALHKSQWAAMVLPVAELTGALSLWGHNANNSYRYQHWKPGNSERSFDTTLNWNLFNSFQDLQKTRAASKTKEAAEQSALAAKQDRAFAAIDAYYALDSQTELVEVAKQNLKAQEEQYRQSLDLYKNGMRSLADLLKSETDLRSSELRIVSAESRRKEALVSFNLLINRTELASARLKAELAPGATALPSLDADMSRALEQRPEIARARKDAARAKIARQQAMQNLFPSLKADLEWTRSGTSPFDGPGAAGTPNPRHSAGLSVSLPLGFNLFSQSFNAAAAAAEKRKSESELENEIRTVRKELTGAYIALERALGSYSIAVVKEDIARRALDLVSGQYRQGSTDAIRMNQAQNDFLDARVQKAAALRDIFIERARYKRAAGDPLW